MDTILQFLREFSHALATGQGVPLGLWSYVALSVLVLVEGPIVTLLGAAASSAGFMDPFLVFVAAGVGNLTADFLWYGLGYLGKADWLVDNGGWLDLRRAHIRRLTRDMNQHARKLILLAKLTVSVSVPVLIATGVAKVPLKRWFYVIFIGEAVWTGGLVWAGYHFTRSISQLEVGLQIVAILTVLVFLGIVARYVYRLTQVWSDLPDLEPELKDKPSID